MAFVPIKLDKLGFDLHPGNIIGYYRSGVTQPFTFLGFIDHIRIDGSTASLYHFQAVCLMCDNSYQVKTTSNFQPARTCLYHRGALGKNPLLIRRKVQALARKNK